jgi:hypothetical protein
LSRDSAFSKAQSLFLDTIIAGFNKINKYGISWGANSIEEIDF